MTIGFIGLGRMGSGMARNLARSGAPLLVYDAVPAAVAALTADGAQAATSIADLAARADVIFTSLPGPPEVEEVVLGESGIAGQLRPGLTLFDLSTNSLATVQRIHARFEAAGAAMLDAPVSGGPAGAASGDLVLWVGGDRAVFDRYAETLKVIGRSSCHVGPIGAGTVTKLAHNTLGYTLLLAQAEIFSLAVKAGMEPLELWKALRLGLVGKRSPLDMLVNQFLPGVFDKPAFALKLGTKDVTLATELARQLGIPMRIANLVHAEMVEACAKGMGDMDSRAYLQLQLERAGVTIAVDPERLAEAVKATQG